jgi:hypothetical protein
MSKMKDWEFLSGDMNWEEYDGSWYYCVGSQKYYVLRLIYLQGHDPLFDDKYCCEVLYVDLKAAGKDSIQDAMDFCGIEDVSKVEPAWLVDALVSYGTYATLDSVFGDAYPLRIRAAARRIADNFIDSDKKLLSKALNKPANAIGSTARDMMKGDCLAGLKRSAKKVMMGGKVDDASKLMMKAYHVSRGNTLGGKIETEIAVAGGLIAEGFVKGE